MGFPQPFQGRSGEAAFSRRGQLEVATTSVLKMAARGSEVALDLECTGRWPRGTMHRRFNKTVVWRVPKGVIDGERDCAWRAVGLLDRHRRPSRLNLYPIVCSRIDLFSRLGPRFFWKYSITPSEGVLWRRHRSAQPWTVA